MIVTYTKLDFLDLGKAAACYSIQHEALPRIPKT